MQRLGVWGCFRRFCASASREAAGKETSQQAIDAARANAGIRAFVDSGDGAGAAKTGRPWRTAELRLKSFEDLHRLWYVLVRERNVLLTEKEWCRSNGRHWLRGQSNLWKVKRSMARLKGVVGERTRAHNAQLEIREAKQAEEQLDVDEQEQAASQETGKES